MHDTVLKSHLVDHWEVYQRNWRKDAPECLYLVKMESVSTIGLMMLWVSTNAPQAQLGTSSPHDLFLSIFTSIS